MDNQKHQAFAEGPERRNDRKRANREVPGELVLVGIGASAGGLKALESFFVHLPDVQNMAFVVIVHLSPEHESQMAELLQQHTEMPVKQVKEPIRPQAGHVYVIPPEKDLSMSDGHIHLSERSRHGHAPVDLFFRTLAETHGRHTVGIILSGTGSDGAAGLARIKEGGGLTMAQSPEEAEFSDMPRSAVETGHVDVILPVAELGQALREFAQSVDRNAFPAEGEALSEDEKADLARILSNLRIRTGHDFTNYKLATILRRLTRRLHLTRTNDLRAYLRYLQDHTDEGHNLLNDLLLTVTNFFRDPEAFAALEKEVLPKLFEDKAPDESVRAWICGCATGEEAYSVAMLLLEEFERASHLTPLQLFASDISEEALSVAREGLYPDAIGSDVTAERLSRFFDRERGGYQIKNEVREKIVFAVHNLLQDPPFSKLDLITCRNVLIYLDRSIHGRVLELFHYALQPDGFLFLGDAESIDSPELFHAVDKQHGLYQRTAGTAVIRPSISIHGASSAREPVRKKTPNVDRARISDDLESVHRGLIAAYAPPSLVVNADHHIVHTLGGGEKYLKFTPGRPTQDILKVVSQELRTELRMALYKAFRKSERTESRVIPVRLDGAIRDVKLVVEPIAEEGFAGDHVHIVFHEGGKEDSRPAHARAEERKDPKQERPWATSGAAPSSIEEAEAVIRQLEAELDHVKEQLRTTTEEYEATSEEMTASNEEMQSVNEELRSTSEELETSKEELQSTNEELLALNEELRSKVDVINGINSDLKNLMNATEIGTIFLDRHLCIKRYTPRVEDLFDISSADVGGPLAELAHRLGSDALPSDAARVLRELEMIEWEVQHTTNRQWFLVRLRPYHSIEGTIDGVVITFIDITERKVYDEHLEALIATLESLVADRAHQIKRLASELILSEQTERQRIAQLLHDDLQQLLIAFQMRVEPLSETLSAEQATRLAQANALIARALDVTRTLTVELSPPVLKGDDFTVTLDWLALRMEDMHKLKVNVESPGPIPLPPAVRTLLYQLARELLFNVVKHAGIDEARVELVRAKNQIILRVEDRGAGFDPVVVEEIQLSTQGGFGLRSVKQRLQLFGGRLEMDAAPGEGTRAIIYVPLDEKIAGMETTTSENAQDEKGDPR